MSYKLVAFVYSSDSIISEYINNQIQAISILFPELETEVSNENDTRLVLYSTTPDRFPSFMLFEDNIFKTGIVGKFNDDELFSWVSNNSR